MLGLLLASLLLLVFLLHVTCFPTDYGGPATGDIHVVPIVLDAAVIFDINGVPAVVASLHAVAGFTTFASPRAFAGVPIMLAVLLLLSFLLLLKRSCYCVVSGDAIVVIRAVSCQWIRI